MPANRRTRARRRKGALPVRQKNLEVFVPGLAPEHEGLRIAQLSDVHAGWATSSAQIEAAVEIANAAKPDLIALTGDYICLSRFDLPVVRRSLGGLNAAPVFAILGNHDHWAGGDRVSGVLEDLGYQVLRNAHRTLNLGGADLHVVGLDDPVSKRHCLNTSFADLPKEGSRLVLAHCARIAPQIADYGADLLLSGHTHAGQIYLPKITDALGKRTGIRYMRGQHQLERMTVYVTSGVGNSAIPLRIGHGTQAEVAVLTLRSAEQAMS